MNINAIKRQCKARGYANILTAPDGRQWISNGVAAWPVESLQIDRDGLASLFNLSEKQRGKMAIIETNTKSRIYSIETVPGEIAADVLGAFRFCGAMVIALETPMGAVYIPEEPIAHVREDAMWFSVRLMNDGNPVVAVYDGLLCAGLVTPFEVNNEDDPVWRAARKMSARPYIRAETAAEAEEQAEALAREIGI